MGYRLGGGRPANIGTVALAPVVNRTGEPAIELQITHAMRERIQIDGRWKLANSPDSADGVITITLKEYDMVPVAFLGSDKSTPKLYRLRLSGTAVLRDGATGNEISKAAGYGDTTLSYQSDLTSAKREALPAAADEFAKYLLDDLIEQW